MNGCTNSCPGKSFSAPSPTLSPRGWQYSQGVDVARQPYVAGQFLWIKIDYLDEATLGRRELADWRYRHLRLYKTSPYFHQSVWRPDEPLVRIAGLNDCPDIGPGKLHWGFPKMAGHWNWPPYKNDTVRVATVTNCETVELLVNGQSLEFGKRWTMATPPSCGPCRTRLAAQKRWGATVIR